MQKIKVPMRCKLERMKQEREYFSGLYDEQLRITLTPEPVQQSFNLSSPESADYVQLVFYRYMQNFLKVDLQNLYAIRRLLISAKVDNAFDMLALTEQLLPMLEKTIAQADSYNYELEIIK